MGVGVRRMLGVGVRVGEDGGGEMVRVCGCGGKVEASVCEYWGKVVSVGVRGKVGWGWG